MATTITAGNATNGIVITPDNTGILELKTGTGAGTTALTLNASQNATFAGTLQVAGVTTNMYPIVSSTAVSASGTSVQFTNIPSWAKRITVMFRGVSTNGTNTLQVQLGTGVTPTYATSGYATQAAYISGGSVLNGITSTGFMVVNSVVAANAYSCTLTLTLLTGNTWTGQSSGGVDTAGINAIYFSAGSVALGAALTAVRIIAGTAGSPVDTFDAGSINIMWE